MTSVVPVSWNSWWLTDWIGLTLVRFGCGMCEPVTTISVVVAVVSAALASVAAVICWTGEASAGVAASALAVVAPIASSVAPKIMVDANRRSRTVVVFKAESLRAASATLRGRCAACGCS